MDKYKKADGEFMVRRWLSSMRGDSDLEKIILSGIKNLPKKLDKLKKAIEKNIREDIRLIAHNIKGVYGNLGINEVYKLSLKIDEEIKKDRYSIDIIKKLFNELKGIVGLIPDKYLKGTIIKTALKKISRINQRKKAG